MLMCVLLELFGAWRVCGPSAGKVGHEDCEPDQLLDGTYSVTVQLRTTLFAQNRARLRDTTPNPRGFFQGLASVVCRSMGALPWQLPDLAHAQQAFAAGASPQASVAQAGAATSTAR